jgi:hypothetical protein
MAKRHNLKKVAAETLVVDKTVNFREDYDVPSMIEEIRHAGRVLEPIHARMDDNVVLKGNRRVSAVQSLLADPKLPTDLRQAIEKLDVIYYEGLDAKELTEIVLDHGSQKPLSRVETVMACWRLQKQMYSEDEVITLLYHMLARYTGNTQKAYEAGNIPEGPARKEFLKKWLHGTVGNYILAAGTMGETVREQFILTERSQDRALTEDEKKLVKFTTSRDRINKLASAKKKDKEGPKGWNPADGGEEFNAKIAEFIREDSGVEPPKDRKPTSGDMVKTAESMKSALSKAYLHCAGTLPKEQRVDIDALDTELFRLDEIKKATAGIVDRIEAGAQFSGGEIREVFRLFLTGNAVDYANYITRFAPKQS